MLNELWVEKYRPRSIDDIVLTDNVKAQLKSILDSNDLPHLLLVGKPGTGKTTIALVIKEELLKSDDDLLFLNASDKRGINVVRNIVLEFIKVPPLESPLKLVILDEADYLTPDSFAALRNPIENKEFNAGGYTRFIFTANFANKIPDFIKSRCVTLTFSYMPMDEMFSRATSILQAENIKYDDEVVRQLIITYYPDFRAIVNLLQQASYNGQLQADIIAGGAPSINSTVTEFIYETLCKINTNESAFKELQILRQYLRDKIFSYETVCQMLMTKFAESNAIGYEAIVIVDRYMNTMDKVVSKEHHFNAMLYELVAIKLKTSSLFGG